MVERVPQVPLVKEGQEATQLLPAKQGQGQGDAQTTTGDTAGSGFFLPQAGGALSSTGKGAKGFKGKLSTIQGPQAYFFFVAWAQIPTGNPLEIPLKFIKIPSINQSKVDTGW